MKKAIAIIGAALSVVYLINPSAGFLEFIPDNLPGVGNIDEAAITAMLIACLRSVGFDPLKVFGKKNDKDQGEVVDID